MRATASHRPWLGVVIAFLLSGAAIGCNGRYEISKDKQGKIVRLDKWTGDVAILEEGKLVPVANVKDEKSKYQALYHELSQFLSDGDFVIYKKTSEECEVLRKYLLKKHPGALCVREETYYIEENGKKLPLGADS